MLIREAFEKHEKEFISPYGCISSESKGRKIKENLCPIRTAFQADRGRILYSNAFRRLKYKTQVFLSPMGDMYRTRMTHTLEVSQMARITARAMRLNEDLTEAVALAHDLGHPPFGHSGETALKEINPDGFSHNTQSLRVVDALERNGRGLNLSFEVRDGILKHSKGYGKIISDDPNELAETYEGRLVRIADIMAYLNHDLDDAERSGVIIGKQVPDLCIEVLGKNHSERAASMINSLIFSSGTENGKLVLRVSDKVCSAMTTLREFLYENVYRSYHVHKEFLKAKKIVSELYEYFMKNEDMLIKELSDMEMEAIANGEYSMEKIVSDLIASMTDRHALSAYSKIFFPSPLV